MSCIDRSTASTACLCAMEDSSHMIILAKRIYRSIIVDVEFSQEFQLYGPMDKMGNYFPQDVFLCKCFKWLFTEEDLTVFCVCFVWREEDLTVPLQVISLHPRSIRELIPQSSNGESDQISRLCKARAEEIHQLSRHLKWNRRSVQAWRRK
ncbi:hypothetical protein LXL04_007057 [Taraxacum kok-saghyz]